MNNCIVCVSERVQHLMLHYALDFKTGTHNSNCNLNGCFPVVCTITMKYAVYQCTQKLTSEKKIYGRCIFYVAVGSKWKQWSGNIVSASERPVLQYISTKAYQPISIPSFYCIMSHNS